MGHLLDLRKLYSIKLEIGNNRDQVFHFLVGLQVTVLASDMRGPRFRSQMSPQGERLLLNHKRCQDSWPLEEKNSIQSQRQGFDCSELLCNRVLLKYKRDRESF